MAYFLKKATLKGRTYISIVESFYSNKKKGTAHRTFKSLGSVETHLANGIDDPIAFFQKEVDLLNDESKAVKKRKIQDKCPIKYLGYFPIKNLISKLSIKEHIDLFSLVNDYDYDLFQILSSLIYARMITPCSKHKTFHDIIPYLFEQCNFSYDQLLAALYFLGNDYEKFVEIFNKEINNIYGLDTSKTYFDCTNFYFEIDREDDFRRKGACKENRNDPIVGLGLLLDSNQIPIAIKMFHGNQSEKPVLRDVIDSLKAKNNINGRTIHVADKGLNCAENIAYSKGNGDGYLFSKSVKQLPETEKVWVLLDKDYKDVIDDNGKLLYRYKSCIDKFPYTIIKNGKKYTVELTEKRVVTYNPSLAIKQKAEINKMVEKAMSLCLSKAKKSEYGECFKYVDFVSVDTDKNINDMKPVVSLSQSKIDKDLSLAGYNLLVTSEIKMEDKEIYNVYHNLWVIENSFRIMKSDLDARPVFLQKEETIKGHFLICYLSVLLERLLQFKVFNNEFNSNELFEFIRKFKVIKSDRYFINVSSSTKFIRRFEELSGLPLTNYDLTESNINSMLNYKI